MVVGKCPAEQEEQVIEAEVNMSLGGEIRCWNSDQKIVIGLGRSHFMPAVVCSYTCLMRFFSSFVLFKTMTSTHNPVRSVRI